MSLGGAKASSEGIVGTGELHTHVDSTLSFFVYNLD